MNEQLYLLINNSWPGDEKYRVTSKPDQFPNAIPIVRKSELEQLQNVVAEAILTFQWVTDNFKMAAEQRVRLGDAIAKLYDAAGLTEVVES